MSFKKSPEIPQIWLVIGSQRESLHYHAEVVSCIQISFVTKFYSFVWARIAWLIFTTTACHSVDRTTWLLIVYTEPPPRTFLVYKCLDLVRISFVLQHYVPPIFIFFLSLQKKKKPTKTKPFNVQNTNKKKQTLNRASYFPMRNTINGSGATGYNRI